MKKKNFIIMNDDQMEINYMETSCQKAGVPGFLGCVGHASVI